MVRGGPVHRYAYATLLATKEYLPGVIALSRSIRNSGTRYPLEILVAESLMDEETVSLLDLEGARVTLASPLALSTEFVERHHPASLHRRDPFLSGEKPHFHSPVENFLKLRVWELEEYERVAFIDADAIALQNPDEIFEFEPFAGAPNEYLRDDPVRRLNSGVFVAEPDRSSFERLLSCLDSPDAYWRRTDQSFLQMMFPNWDRLPIRFNTLQYLWLNRPEVWNWDEIIVLHYQYEKPWDLNHGKTGALGPLIELWHHVARTGCPPASFPPPPRSGSTPLQMSG